MPSRFSNKDDDDVDGGGGGGDDGDDDGGDDDDDDDDDSLQLELAGNVWRTTTVYLQLLFKWKHGSSRKWSFRTYVFQRKLAVWESERSDGVVHPCKWRA